MEEDGNEIKQEENSDGKEDNLLEKKFSGMDFSAFDKANSRHFNIY